MSDPSNVEAIKDHSTAKAWQSRNRLRFISPYLTAVPGRQSGGETPATDNQCPSPPKASPTRLSRSPLNHLSLSQTHHCHRRRSQQRLSSSHCGGGSRLKQSIRFSRHPTTHRDHQQLIHPSIPGAMDLQLPERETGEDELQRYTVQR